MPDDSDASSDTSSTASLSHGDSDDNVQDLGADDHNRSHQIEHGDVEGSEQGLQTGTAADVNARNDARNEPDDGKPESRNDETRLEGLVTLWPPRERGSNDDVPPDVTAAGFDVVVVHGFFGTGRLPWTNPGSGSSEWVPGRGEDGGRRVMSFGYDPSVLLSGVRTQQCIRRLATHLLEDLTAARRESDEKRPILFIAHDLGGIIVKDALTVSSLIPALYGEILDSTRVLVFYGCPHRAVDDDEMEEKLTRFLYRPVLSDGPRLPSPVHSTTALVKAVADINHLFLDSKQIFRSYVFTVFSESGDSSVDKVFDHFTGTMGIPFEIRISDASDHGHGEIKKHLHRIDACVKSNRNSVGNERILLSTASPLLSLKSGPGPDHSFAWISNNSRYKSWYNQRRPQLLYLFGESDTQSASEYIFYDLDKLHLERNGQVVVYFSFDRCDIRRDNIQDMLATVQAQMLGHFPTLEDSFKDQLEQQRLDRSMNYKDLLYWFEYYRIQGEVEGISCVLNHFDECEPTSRKAFLDQLRYISQTQERPWRVLVTSRQPGALSEELSDWPTLDLDRVAPAMDRNVSTLSYEFLGRVHTNVRGCRHEAERDILTISELDISIRELIFQHVVQDEQWPSQRSIADEFGPFETATLESVVVKILDGIPDKSFAIQVLTWILYAVRPPTVWELAAVYHLTTDEGPPTLSSSPVLADDVRDKIRRWLGGIVVFRQREALISTPHIREALLAELGTTTGKSRMAGTLSPGAAHANIAKSCVDYLSSATVKENLEKVYDASQCADTHLALVSDRTSLQDYATQFWVHHLALSSSCPVSAHDSKIDLVSFHRSGAVSTWSKAHWVLSNPFTRSQRPFASLYPVLAGAGLADQAESWYDGDNDVSAGLIEACFNGSLPAIRSLLPRVRHSVESLQQVLTGAGACGDQAAWIELISYIHENYPNFPWTAQGSLVCRAGWLGLHEVLIKLIEIGCPADEVDPRRQRPTTPLRLVVRTNRPDIAKTLLEHGADPKQITATGRTLIHTAATVGNAEMIRLLADHGADIDYSDQDFLTATYVSCLWGNFKATKALVTLGADLNQKVTDNQDEPGWSALTCAIRQKNLECTYALLKGNVNLSTVGVGETPLGYAIDAGFLGICQYLLERGVDPNNHPGSPPMLVLAVSLPECDNRLDIIELLLEKGAHVNEEDGNGRTALWWGCWSNDLQMLAIVTLLLEHGADVNRRVKDGNGPLHIAVARNNVQLLELLLQQNVVDVDMLDGANLTPLARAYANEEMTKTLLRKGADPNLQPAGTDSILLRAVQGDHEAVVRLLVQHNARIDPPDELRSVNLWEPMEAAAVWDKPNILRILADGGGDINRRFGKGYSLVYRAADSDALGALLEFRPDLNLLADNGDGPLHAVTKSTPLENVKLLVRAGADINLANDIKVTPLSEALRYGNEEVANYFLSKKADINVVSPVFGGPLHAACQSGLVNSVKRLIDLRADVNETVPGSGGSPLSSIFYAFEETTADVQTEILNVLLDAGADVMAPTGLNFGTVGVAATWGGTEEHINKLFSKGASFAVEDTMGRCPLHLAAVRRDMGIFNSVLVAGGKPNVKDKCERSLISWAAQGGSIEIFQKALQLAGDKGINEPDLHGWTPLFWAARGVGTGPRPFDYQLEMISELLKRGADKTVKSRLRGKEYTPYGIATYHNCPEDVVKLLRLDDSVPPSGRRLVNNAGFCDFCLIECWGIRYDCKTCKNFCFCYKCHDLKDKIHPVDHEFEAVGDEFEPESDTSSTSDSDTDDESEDEA